ncbi:hypothetical protein [Aeromicrobium chenweiae]|uniref:Uncharacterized protein n=1 Tax=Aeromicrobium chenweiae TaxID=2079793 RepID=A0A2S0WI22_9ACTN|nr:hypothetical protein [Aeromicrobium chenweiae]AWB90985.1 hypothetical protein C3E78_01410 [Aeromicrobium chenweiae]TGN31888.1 hypothetical protein E4L97_10920 [Aeromicrobium chenweiae]
MRSFSSVVAWLVAVLAGIVTVPLLWVSAHVADEDGYVEFSSRLAMDDQLQAAFADYLAEDYVQRGVLPRRLQDVAASALTTAARQTSNQPGFVEAWEATQRSFHRSAFQDGTEPLTVDVSPMAQFVVDRVGDGIPVRLRVPDGLTVQVGSASERAELQRVSQSTTFGLLGLLVVVVAGVTSLLSARSRPLALAGLGVGALVVAGVDRFATSVVTPRLLDEVQEQNAFGRTVQRLLVDRASDSLADWLEWLAIGGAAAVVVGAVVAVVARRP